MSSQESEDEVIIKVGVTKWAAVWRNGKKSRSTTIFNLKF